MAAGVRVVGLRAVVRSLEQMGAEVADLKAAFRKIGQLVADESRQLVRVGATGRLQGSIRPSNAKAKAIVRAGAGIKYAGVQHYGGYHNITPNPFLTEAASDQEPEIIRTFDDELNGLIRRLDLN